MRVKKPAPQEEMGHMAKRLASTDVGTFVMERRPIQLDGFRLKASVPILRLLK